MRKKNKLALFTLLIVALISSLNSSLFAQIKDLNKTSQSQNTEAEKSILQNYVAFSSLTRDKKPSEFTKLSPRGRSEIFKFHLALQLIKRPDLTKVQKDIIKDAVSMLTPDLYDETKDRTETDRFAQSVEVWAKSNFSRQEASEIFSNLGGTSQDAEMVNKYQNITNLSSFPERKIAFRKSSATEMSNLWKVQLALTLAKEADLTTPQRDLIFRLIDFIKPSLYEAAKASNKESDLSDLNDTVELFVSEASTLFPEQKASAIFSKLGFSGSCEASTSSLVPIDEPPIDLPVDKSCSCRTGDCSEASLCGSGGCEETWFGCGFIYLQGCTGECRRR